MSSAVGGGDALRASNDWERRFNGDTLGPFALVSRNLMAIGSVAIEHFLSSPIDLPSSPEKLILPSPPPCSPPHTPGTTPFPSPLGDGQPKNNPEACIKMLSVARLHQTCRHVFGSTDPLMFEFLEENGPSSKQCILTITKPKGPSRSYTTQPIFSRKNDAKDHVASIAINMGAINFITTDDSDTNKRLVLAPPESADRLAEQESGSVSVDPPDTPIQVIEDCCKHWRASEVRPHWAALNEPKMENKHGMALRVELSPHSCRVYSSDTVYKSVYEAKQACATIALDQGVLDYIKFGNGQTQPLTSSTEEMITENTQELITSGVSALASASTLQSFYESLPQPFPENFGNKTASEINAPAWLNTTIQAARGGKLSTHFIWITDGTFGLHGCLLRIDRPGESKSYLVDAKFPKRADAKAAVCLQAMSQGVGTYIRGIASVIENKITPSMRKVANQVLPVLATELNKIRFGAHPIYDFNKEKDAFGCTMRVELSPEDTREYKVPVEYRTKADAKSAVVLLAAEQGIVELLRFRGEPAPPGYIAFLATRSKEAINQPRTLKRKDMDEDDGQDSSSRTKRRKGNKSSNRQGDVPFLKSMKGSLAPRHAHALPSRPFASQSISNHTNVIGPWKNSHTPGSGGLGSISVPARAGHPIGQYRSGSRNVSSFATPHRGGAQGSHSGNLSGSHLPDGRLAYGGGQVASYIAAPHRPPSEPFQRSAYPHSVRPEYGIHSSAAGGAVHYPSSHYASPSHALEHNSGYLPPYGTGPVTQTFYPSSQYMGSYQSMALPSYHAQHPSAVYGAAAASQPATPADYAGTSYAYQIPAQHLSHQPPSRETPQTALSTAEALHNDRSFNDSPHITRDSSSEQELGQIDELRRFQDCHQKESSHDVPASHEQKSQASPSRVERSEAFLTGCSSKEPVPKSGLDSRPVVTIQQPTKSHVAALLDYCNKDGSPRPQFHDETLADSDGTTSYKVWVILGMERLELPVTFSNLNEGRERVAKQVLSRLRLQWKRNIGKAKGRRLV